MRRRVLWAAVSVQSGRGVSFLRRVVSAFTDHSIPDEHYEKSIPKKMTAIRITATATGAT